MFFICEEDKPSVVFEEDEPVQRPVVNNLFLMRSHARQD